MKLTRFSSLFFQLRQKAGFVLLIGGAILTAGCGNSKQPDPAGPDSLQGTVSAPDSQPHVIIDTPSTTNDSSQHQAVKATPKPPVVRPADPPVSTKIIPPPAKAEKPVIYLYPEREMLVKVNLRFKGELSLTYPPCEGEWSVMAQPDGELTDLRDGASLQYLYYEGELPSQPVITSGFVVSKSETVPFLRKSLAQIGLSPREYNDMITYWLPRLQESNYNAIHFTLNSDCDQYCGLEVSPAPETRIRVMMEFTGLDAPVSLPAQALPVVTRKGFTLVEWGGVECPSLVP